MRQKLAMLPSPVPASSAVRSAQRTRAYNKAREAARRGVDEMCKARSRLREVEAEQDQLHTITAATVVATVTVVATAVMVVATATDQGRLCAVIDD